MRLTSDELGEKGESRFREICADAQLICNKSDRDRTGWDFIVEFPFHSCDRSIDEREAPLSCHIQVKTINAGKTTIRLSLSSAERLAKELKPAFIYVLQVNNTLGFQQAFLLHMTGDRLSAILKRLRKEQAEGNANKINKKTITFALKEAEKIDPNGSSFKTAIIAQCGTSLSAYANKKKTELSSIGYDHAPLKGVFEIPATNPEEMLDVFLGLKTKIKLNKFKTVQTRFGIDLPHRDDSGALMTIVPHPIEVCKLKFRDETDHSISVFSADLYTAFLPGVSSDAKILLKTSMFSIAVYLSPSGKNSYTLSYNLNEIKSSSVRNWEQFWRTMKLYSTGAGSFEIERADPSMCVRIPVITNKGFFTTGYCDNWLEFLSSSRKILDNACPLDDPKITFNELISIETEIELAEKLSASNKGVPYSFSYDLQEGGPEILSPGKMVMAKAIPFGDTIIAYYGIGDFTHTIKATTFLSSSDNFVVKRITTLGSIDHFDSFINQATKIEGTTSYFKFDNVSSDFEATAEIN